MCGDRSSRCTTSDLPRRSENGTSSLEHHTRAAFPRNTILALSLQKYDICDTTNSKLSHNQAGFRSDLPLSSLLLLFFAQDTGFHV